MTSIQEFESFLSWQAARSFHEIEINIKRLPPDKPEIFGDLKLAISHALNKLYFEMLDFLTWLEQENSVVNSRKVKVLIDDLRKDNDQVRDLQAYVSSLSTAGPSFKNKSLFQVVQQSLIKRTRDIAAELEQYVEELKVLEQELYGASAILKRAENYLFATPVMAERIKQKIEALDTTHFLSQKAVLASQIQFFSEQIEEQYQLLRKLRKVSALKRVLASLQLARNNLNTLAKTILKTDPKVWKDASASFEVFRKHLLEDLEGAQKILAVGAEDLDDVREQLAA
ncbi:MAG: hypothetical protein AABX31_03695 [Nanoarchaeota archaeon]|mgnify:CR=1 FL=1